MTLKDVNCWMAQDIHNRKSGVIASILVLVCLADATFAIKPLTLNVNFIFILAFIFILNAGSCCSGWKLTFFLWGSVLYDEESWPHVKQAINSFPNWRKEDGAEQLVVLLPSSGSWLSESIGNLHVFHAIFFCVCRSWDLSSWLSFLFCRCTLVCSVEFILFLFSSWILSPVNRIPVQHLMKRRTSLKL